MTSSTVSAAPVSALVPLHGSPPTRAERATEGVLSSLNPLHHIPVVSAVYGQLSETKALPAVRILVGAAVAGPLGFVAALADAILEEATGRTAGGHVVAAIAGDSATAVATGDADLKEPGLPARAGVPAQGLRLSSAAADATTSQSARRGIDPRAARELARTYLFDLALQHKPQPAQIDGGDIG